jgi:hypothetical protein
VPIPNARTTAKMILDIFISRMPPPKLFRLLFQIISNSSEIKIYFISTKRFRTRSIPGFDLDVSYPLLHLFDAISTLLYNSLWKDRYES